MAVSSTFSVYAEEAACQGINTDMTNEFARVWIVCITYGILVATIITVPVYWCSSSKASNRLEKYNTLKKIEHRDADDKDADDAKERDDGNVGCSSSFQEHWADDVKEPDFEEARKHLLETSCTDIDGRLRGVWSTKLHDMAEIGGPGLELYFKLVLNLGYAFMFMSIVTAPITMFSWNGNFVPDTGSVLAKTTVGNLGWVTGADVAQEDRLVVIGCQGMDIKKLTKLFGYLEVISLLIYIGVVVHFRFRVVPKAAEAAKEENITVADFSLEIDGLPEVIGQQSEYAQELNKHLKERMAEVRENASKGGCCKRKKKPPPGGDAEVIELTLVRDFGKRLHKVKDRAILMKEKALEEFKKNDSTVTKLKAKIEKLDNELQKKVKPDEELPVLRAYAILSTIPDVDGLLVDYRFANFKLLKCCQSRANRFLGSAIRLRRPPEPSSIICVNADVPWKERLIRQILMLIAWFVALCITAAIIFLIYGSRVDEEDPASNPANHQLRSAVCDSSSHPTSGPSGYLCDYQVASLWNNSYARTLSGDDLSCFCTTKGFAQISQEKELYNDICKDWLTEAAKGVTIGVFSSLVVVLLNVILRLMINVFVDWERHQSTSAEEASRMSKIFGTQYVNTALIILFMNWYLEDFKLYLLGDGEYSDFDRGWYAVVGGAMVTNMMLNSFLSSASLIGTFIWKKLRRCGQSCCTYCCGTIKTHAELLELYTNPLFDISARFAQLMMTCYCTLTYCSGMPILTLFAAVYCFISYWTDKLVLLKGSQRPPIYDVDMPRLASQVLLFAAPIHAILAIGMYSNLCTFPSDPVGGTLATLQDQAMSLSTISNLTTSTTENGLYARATRESTWMISVSLLLMVALFAVWIVLQLLGATFGELLALVQVTLCPSKIKVADEENSLEAIAQKISWTAAEKYLQRACPPTSYAIEANRDFAPYYMFMTSQASEVKDEQGDVIDEQVEAHQASEVKDEQGEAKDEQVEAQAPPDHMQELRQQASDKVREDRPTAKTATPDESLPTFGISVKTITGKNVLLDVRSEYTVEILKESIAAKEDISPSNFRLLLNGTNLADSSTLAQCGIVGGSILFMLLRTAADEEDQVGVEAHQASEVKDEQGEAKDEQVEAQAPPDRKVDQVGELPEMPQLKEKIEDA